MRAGPFESQTMAFVSAANIGENPRRVRSPKHTRGPVAQHAVEIEHARVAVVSRPIRNKVRPDEVADELILGGSDREAFAKSCKLQTVHVRPSPVNAPLKSMVDTFSESIWKTIPKTTRGSCFLRLLRKRRRNELTKSLWFSGWLTFPVHSFVPWNRSPGEKSI